MRSGLEVLVGERAQLLRGRRVGLLCHQASVTREWVHARDAITGCGANLVRLFAPEHGITGGAQDMAAVGDEVDSASGVQVVSLYGETEDSLTPKREHLADLDVLVADLQDVGARYYTFAATVLRALPVAAAADTAVVVTDRPNPIDGMTVSGGAIAEGFHSFVGEISIPQRHGLTIGEMCALAQAERSIDVDLTVIPCDGWSHTQYFDETDLPWVLPSPNMPTLDTAIVYPGGCLFEGTNLSEARGTTRPFELVGAPWLNGDALRKSLDELDLPGVAFRAAGFEPGFQKHAGKACEGVQIHVTDRHAFDPILTGLAVIIAARDQDRESFAWRTETYEFVDHIPAFDLLAGSSAWREAIENGATARDVMALDAGEPARFRERAEPFLLYS